MTKREVTGSEKNPRWFDKKEGVYKVTREDIRQQTGQNHLRHAWLAHQMLTSLQDCYCLQ